MKQRLNSRIFQEVEGERNLTAGRAGEEHGGDAEEQIKRRRTKR